MRGMCRVGPALVVAVIAGLVLPACRNGNAGTGDSEGPGINAPDYTGEWTLWMIGTDEVSGLLPAGSPAPSLSIASDGMVGGNAGVNRLESRFDASAASRGEPLFGPMVTTKMAGPEPLMSLERRFTEALSRAARASIEAGNLELYDGAGNRLVVMTPMGR